METSPESSPSSQHIEMDPAYIVAERPTIPSPQHIQMAPESIIVQRPHGHSYGHENSSAGGSLNHGDSVTSRSIEFDPVTIVVPKPTPAVEPNSASPNARAMLSSPVTTPNAELIPPSGDIAPTPQDRANTSSPGTEARHPYFDYPSIARAWADGPFDDHTAGGDVPSFVYPNKRTPQKPAKTKSTKPIARKKDKPATPTPTYYFFEPANISAPQKEAILRRRMATGQRIARHVANTITSLNDLPWHLYAAPGLVAQHYLARKYENELLELADPESDILLWKKRAELALRLGWGNCGEKAAATAYLLAKENAEEGIEDRIEIMNFANSDHAFVVVGRDPKSNVEDPYSWGPAVVVDSWAGTVYPADRFYFHSLNLGKVIALEVTIVP